MPEYEFIWTNGVLVETVELPPPPVIDFEIEDEAEQFEGVPEDFHLHIIEICLICGNPMESCVCEMPRLQKSSIGCDLTATEGERMDYLRDIQGSP